MSETSSPLAPQDLTKRQFGWAIPLTGLLIVAMILAGGMFGGYFEKLTSADDDDVVEVNPLPVNVTEITFVSSIEQTRTYTGTIRARLRSDLAFEIPGKILSILVDEGAVVSQGAELANLDIETLDAQMGATMARLEQANSLLKELKAGPRAETIQAARASAAAAKSLHDNAALNLTRRKKLREAGAISVEEYDQARFAERTAQANWDAAKEQLTELESGTRPEKVAGQESAVRQLESAKKEIDVAISKSTLLAPFSGTVTRRYLDQGSIARASEPIIKLVKLDSLEAWVGLPVSIVAGLEIGSRHEILVDGKAYGCEVTAKIQELDPATRTQTVLLVLDSSASSKVVSGQLCEIQITSTVETSGFWIPTSALVKGARGLWSVMVVKPVDSGAVFLTQKRDIEIVKTGVNRVLAKGTIADGDLVVDKNGDGDLKLGDIVEGDRIVFDGVHRIAEGQMVMPMNAP